MTSTTDPNLKSFIPVAATAHFPIQNLPYGVFRPRDGGAARVGVAIGDYILDLAALESRGLLPVPGAAEPIFNRPALNAFMALGREAWQAVRARVSELLRHDTPTLQHDDHLREAVLVRQDAVEMLLPAEIGDYTDFYSSRHHATNVGTMIRGAEHALQENWLHLPVAYHGRASSIVASGVDVRRPRGQTGAGKFGPSRAVDFELETGFFVGPGNSLGSPIPIVSAADHIFGLVLVNDWSARDIQKWEYVPLGPFLAKNFATSISPWVVTLEALEPFRTAGPAQDPPPLEYLALSGDWNYNIELEVTLQTPGSDEQHRLTHSSARYLYWNMCQQLAHHTVNGCNLRPGDLLASGTISGPQPTERGCLLELTWGGQQPIELANGQQRSFLADGDRVTMTGWAQGDGYRIGLGEVTATLLPASD